MDTIALYTAVLFAAFRFGAHTLDQLFMVIDGAFNNDPELRRQSKKKLVKLFAVTCFPAATCAELGFSLLPDMPWGEVLTGLSFSAVMSGLHGTGSVLLDLIRARTEYNDTLTQVQRSTDARTEDEARARIYRNELQDKLGHTVRAAAQSWLNNLDPSVYLDELRRALQGMGLPPVEIAFPPDPIKAPAPPGPEQVTTRVTPDPIRKLSSSQRPMNILVALLEAGAPMRLHTLSTQLDMREEDALAALTILKEIGDIETLLDKGVPAIKLTDQGEKAAATARGGKPNVGADSQGRAPGNSQGS